MLKVFVKEGHEEHISLEGVPNQKRKLPSGHFGDRTLNISIYEKPRP